MTPFSAIASYYDLMYQDKDYRAEAEFVHGLIMQYGKAFGSILELGCGTGGHAVQLAEMGYPVRAVDVSNQMLSEALKRTESLPADVSGRIQFSQGDMRNVAMERKFDVTISLFHVVSYMTSNADLHAACKTARLHMNDGGLFIFDFWYGPAVLNNLPEVRIKRMQNDLIEVIRTAEPQLLPNENIVEVNYHVVIRERSTQKRHELREQHRMRYLFMPEINLLLEQNCFRQLSCSKWMSDEEPSLDSWGVCVVAEAI